LVKIFEEQKHFAQSPEGFLNILTKTIGALFQRCDWVKHDCSQIFTESDKQFTQNSTLHSAGIAVIRSSNERSVKTMKLSWRNQNGANNLMQDLQVTNDFWLAWGFQAT
jgi:hypothetical protein